jgi:hypothetical protein
MRRYIFDSGISVLKRHPAGDFHEKVVDPVQRKLVIRELVK